MNLSIYYLIPSLPTLKLEEQPTLSSIEFISRCQTYLSSRDFKTVKKCGLFDFDLADKPQAMDLWLDLEKKLRLQLVMLRAARMGKDPALSLPPKTPLVKITPQAQEIFDIPNPLDREKALYQRRWTLLDRIQMGHYFDLNWLVLYYLKIQLCERFHLWNPSRGKETIDHILQGKKNG